MLPNTTPSLVLLDVMLPQTDGFTTCQKIRESSEVPIIMVTAMDRDEDKVRGLEIGADHYITKPLSTHELASRVKSVLR
jgi:DNA-binding response OmpR family regulator